MKYKWKPVLAAITPLFIFSSPLTALATDNTVSTIEDELVLTTGRTAEARRANADR